MWYIEIIDFIYYFVGIGSDGLLTPEIIVSWLLEHPEVTASDTESLSSYYSSDSESVSEKLDLALQALEDYVSWTFSCKNRFLYIMLSVGWGIKLGNI